jgi:hypothetical protein
MTTTHDPATAGSAGSTGGRRKRLRTAVRRASDAFDLAASSARTLGSRLSATAQATRTKANATTTALQTLPDSTLRELAVSSVGLGAGFYLAGVPRLATAAAVAPALIIGAAIMVRPGDDAIAAVANG